MFRWFFAFLSLSLAPAMSDEIRYTQLNNGLDIYVIEDETTPVVVQTMWYHVGAADEIIGKSGIAHYLEHLMFRGSDLLEDGEFSQTVTRLGGADNAFTSWDYTAYFQRFAPEHLEVMMRMEASRMRGLDLDDEDIIAEKGVVLEERNQRTDNNPSALFQEQLRAAQYLNHPYGRPIIGWRHEIEDLSRDDIFNFYNTYYAPNNATLVVAGNIDYDTVIELAERYYGQIEPTENIKRVRKSIIEPPQLAERRIEMSDARVSQPYMLRSYLVDERNTGQQEDAAAFTLLAAILGGNNTTSYLAEKLVFEQKLALYVSTSYSGTSKDQTSFNIVVVPNVNVSLDTIEAALDTELRNFATNPINEAHLERLKTQIRAAEIYEKDNLQGRAINFGQQIAIGLSVDDIETWPRLLNEAPSETIMQAAQILLKKENAVSGYLMPGDEQ